MTGVGTRDWDSGDGKHWWFTPNEAAKIAHCSPETIRRWVRADRLRTKEHPTRVHIGEVMQLQGLMGTRRKRAC